MRSASADQSPSAGLRWPVLIFLMLSLLTKLVGIPQPSVQTVFVLGCFVIPFWWATGRGRQRLLRLRWWLLAAHVVVTYLPFAVLGNGWIGGMSGFLAALVLLIVPSPWRWLTLGVIIGVELTVWLGVVGVPYEPVGNSGPWVVIALLTNALALFGLSALADTVADLHRTRTELADRSVARVRLAAAAHLRATVDSRIVLVAAQTRAALRRLSTDAASDPTAGRAEIAAAAANARAVVAGARTVANTGRDDALEASARAADRRGTPVVPRLVHGVLAVLLVNFALQNVLNAAFPYSDDVWIRQRGWAIAVAVLVSIVVPVLQWRHSTAPAGTRPSRWPATLTVMAVLAVLPYPFVGAGGLVLMTFVAASVLLLVPGRAAWFWFALPQVAVIVLSVSGPDTLTHASTVMIVNYAAATLTVAVTVYGLSRLSAAVAELDQMRRDLADLAVVREQLRLAQDTHDLLGLGLSTLALKADLAAALLDHDTARARRELADMLRVCAAVRADAAGITADSITLTLAAEMAVATEILTASGVHTELPASVPDLPSDTDALLARVVREAVTNSLRHGGGRWVSVELRSTASGLVLRIANDARPAPTPPAPADGRGLANLEDRLAEHDGCLTADVDGDTFVLIVGLPPAATEVAAPV